MVPRPFRVFTGGSIVKVYTFKSEPKPAPASVAMRALRALRDARRAAAVAARDLAREESAAAAKAQTQAAKFLRLVPDMADTIFAEIVALADHWATVRRESAQAHAAATAAALAALQKAEQVAEMQIATAAAADRARLATMAQTAIGRARHAFTVGSARAVKRSREDLRALSIALDLPDPDRALACGALGQYAALWRPNAIDRAVAFGDRAMVENDADLDAILLASGRYAAAVSHDGWTEIARTVLPSDPVEPLARSVEYRHGWIADCRDAAKGTCNVTIDPDWI